MQIGMIGLGRMGSNMVRRLTRGGHECIIHDVHPDAVKDLVHPGAIPASSLGELVERLSKPRIVWLMVPAAVVDSVLTQLQPLLSSGDIVIDGGNSFYRDDIRRGTMLRERGINYLDVGTSGGVFGLERGYCLMIGGDSEPVQHLAPIFATLSPGRNAVQPTHGRQQNGSTADAGYLHCGPQGAGHFVKMIHNGIEYGLMAAYAEGLNILRNANIGTRQRDQDAETAPLSEREYYAYDFDLPEIVELWRRGSVIGSWLLDLTANALLDDPDLEKFAGRVSDSGEGRWTLDAAIDEGVPAPILASALFQRFTSRGNSAYANRVLSAMRHQFGGHEEKKDGSAHE